MRRLLIFCDGTWNTESGEYPTNVVSAARAAKHVAADGTVQLVCYVQGVGTSFIVSRLETFVAGAFGWGLFDKIAEAYRFLVFNYEPGDEIFVFGFSRGAFTARSLAGLIRKCGIIQRSEISKVREAYDFYRRADVGPDDEDAQMFRALHSPATIMKDIDREWRRKNDFIVPDVPNFTVRYIGVWDTVGELGVPKYVLLGHLLNHKYQFHDLNLSSTVVAARQALAVDETRVEFEPAPWQNLAALNATPGREGNYVQHWFPGDHGSVGGGGEIAGLYIRALAWVMEGAVEQGLALEEGVIDNWNGLADPLAALHNTAKPDGFVDRYLYRHGPRRGPTTPDGTLANTTRERLLHGRKDSSWLPYRPASLRRLIEDYPEVIGEGLDSLPGPLPPS
jgi:uncharacterized protein (DUF2235 family)